MTLLDRFKPALQSLWLPLALLLLALSTVFIFGGDRGHFYRCCVHNGISSEHLTIAVNISPEHGFQRFTYRFVDEDGDVRYDPYNRFPIGSHASMKLATLPFGGSPSAQIAAARMLMLLFFAAAAVLAYLSLCRLVSNRWIALTATLLAFSSYYLLYYSDMTAVDGMPDFFGVMLAFHGMVVFVQEGRFRQLLVKTCIALLLGWHVLALLVPFVIFGLVRDLIRARKATASSTPPYPPPHYVKRIASTLFRSPYLLIGIVALGLVLSILTFNFTMEYVALGGETSLTELPSFKSMLKRTGRFSDFNERHASFLSWPPFLEVQFRNVLRMFIPYPLLGFRPDRYFNNAEVDGYPTWLSEFQGVVLGIALVAACLIGSMFVRHKMLFATLASFGFFWALPMRNNTATVYHDFETMYYIGLPLVFFTLILLLARRLTRRDGVIVVAAVGALLLFTFSSFQMGRFGLGPEAAQAARDVHQDLLAIHELVGGDPVTVRSSHDIQELHINVLSYNTHYYLNPIVVRREYYPSEDRGFIVMYHRVDADSLLTPQNRYFFLYNGPDLIASYRSAYPSIVSSEPVAREDFDVYVDEGRVHYVKEPCRREDTRARFSLHVFPEDIDDLPDNRRQYRFDNLDFRFTERGLLFDGKCMLRVNLPQYDVASIRTARLHGDGHVWMVSHVIQGPKLISEYPSIVAHEPSARSEFDLYIDEGNLYYVKEPCSIEDVQDGFFLHIVPAYLDDLPDNRTEHGFDNLDFGFDVRGVQFDGKCAASVGLPQYGIARITTGQYDEDGRIWAAEIVSEYPSIVSGEPIARSEFDLYLAKGKLHYVKEPCESEDVQDGFFLHIVPEDIDDLPDARTEYGFDNLDFGFDVRGVQFDGKCLASINLPQYDIARITTGQYDGVDRIWEVELGPDALE